jgi:hypothetical protein
MNELFQLRPVLLIEAGYVGSVDVGEIGFSHIFPHFGWAGRPAHVESILAQRTLTRMRQTLLSWLTMCRGPPRDQPTDDRTQAQMEVSHLPLQ